LLGTSTAEERKKIADTLMTIGLGDYAGMRAGSLSHGQKQWLEIGMVILQDPSLLLVDEPVAGMTDKDRPAVTIVGRKACDCRDRT
jgi:urea transport system ATP-binding protein